MIQANDLIYTDTDGNKTDVSNSILIRDWVKSDKSNDLLNVDRLLDWRNRLVEMKADKSNSAMNKANYDYEIIATDFLLSIYSNKV